MKYILTLIILSGVIVTSAQTNTPPTLKSILLEQLKTTHNVKDWFVPVDTAIAWLTPEQANWKDSNEDHSIAQLTTHLIFWNTQILYNLKGVKPPEAFNGNNKETFSPVDKTSWPATVKRLDSVLTAIEEVVSATDDAKLQRAYSTI
ncbi:MAG TPA: DinB family protein, partial [Parafilimonas sp.]|nr:DinB family protein [Parafilimonas sp.]